MNPSVSLIISTYEQPVSLGKVLRGVAQQTCRPEEIFVADDGSGSQTRELIETWRRDTGLTVHHVWHPHDGFRKVILLNQAVARASGDYLVFLDGDCVPERHFVEDHKNLAEPGYWVQGRRAYVQEDAVRDFEPGASSVLGWIVARKIRGVAKAVRLPSAIVFRNKKQRGIIGCNMAFWRKDVLAVNGFDESFLGRGIGPDSDLGTRIYNLGCPRKFVYGRAIVYHLDHPVMPRDNLEAKKQWLAETIRTRKTRCDLGLEQYLKG